MSVLFAFLLIAIIVLVAKWALGDSKELPPDINPELEYEKQKYNSNTSKPLPMWVIMHYFHNDNHHF